METQGSLLCYQETITGPYPDLVEPSLYCHPVPFQGHVNIIGPSIPGPPKWDLSFRVSDQNTSIIWVSHFPHICYSPAGLILLDFVSLLIVDEKYKL